MNGSNGIVTTVQNRDKSEGGAHPLRWIEPRQGLIAIEWAELWQYRELTFFLSCAISRSGTTNDTRWRSGRSCNR